MPGRSHRSSIQYCIAKSDFPATASPQLSHHFAEPQFPHCAHTGSPSRYLPMEVVDCSTRGSVHPGSPCMSMCIVNHPTINKIFRPDQVYNFQQKLNLEYSSFVTPRSIPLGVTVKSYCCPYSASVRLWDLLRKRSGDAISTPFQNNRDIKCARCTTVNLASFYVIITLSALYITISPSIRNGFRHCSRRRNP